MSESDIRLYISDDNARFIARLCKMPRKTSEIVLEIMKHRGSSDRDSNERIVSQHLNNMEALKMLTYTAGKWKASELVMSILTKYYGEDSE